MRSALCAVLLSGCLIVHADEQPLDDPCPKVTPDLLAGALGPFVIGDAIYFVGANGTLSRLGFDDGVASELTSNAVDPTAIATDGPDVYWVTNGIIMRKPVDGSAYAIATGYAEVTRMIADDTSVVWASKSGLDRWSKADQTIEHLDDTDFILGLGASDGRYYYSDTHGDRVRRAPPIEDIAAAHFPGPLIVDASGVYFYEAAEPFADYGGAIRLVPREGGAIATTADELAFVPDLTSDTNNLYFVSTNRVENRIKQVSRFGGTVYTLACSAFQGSALYIGIAGDYLYWTDGVGLYRLQRGLISPF